MRHRLPLGFGAIAAAFVLAGCGTPGVADGVSPGVPPGAVLDPLSEGPVAAWVEEGSRFAVVTWGSSSCPSVATELTVEADDRLSLTFGPSPNDPCTADIAPTTHEFELPDSVTGRPVTITVGYEEWDETHILTLD